MNRNRGFTIIELMIVIVVTAIGITLAVPSFNDLIERKALGGAAEAAYEQLQRARSQALKRSKAILVDFHVDGTNWAIGFTDKMGGCSAESTVYSVACSVEYNNDGIGNDRVLMRIVGSDYKNITMSQNVGFADPAVFPGACVTTSDEQACFDFVRGLARTGQYDFASANYKLRVEVTLLGHINICVPPSEKGIPGYRVCGA